MNWFYYGVSLFVEFYNGKPLPKHIGHSERGLSQSTEMAIIIAGVVIVAASVVAAITKFVNSNLPT
ncbi:MAG: hypothetical protein CR979_01610 [Propionibacterium sp.]|nr:MAG: hypothetical protein CR979_01610 [Propionibacterium sp.]